MLLRLDHALMITLHHGDCLEVLKALPSCAVDLILADLPYGTTACKWDVVIPFEPLWAEYRRLLKPRGAVVLTASQPFTSMLVMSNPGWFKYSLVWEKSSAGGFLGAKFRPLKSHEDILVYSPAGCSFGSNPPMAYSPQMGGGIPYVRSGRNGALNLAVSRSESRRTDTTSSNGARWPRSVLYFASETTGIHPTQKPVTLMEYLIRTYSNEGDTVLDNAMGSGTTLVACLNTNRDGIGIEKDAAIFQTAKARLEAVEASVPLFAAAP